MNTHRKRFLAAILAGTTSLAMTAPVLAQEVDEVIVTGSHIKKKSQFDSASPISTIDQAEIDTTGFTTTSELIRWMPYNTGSENQANALTQGGTPGTSNINLRGLGLGSTLVLINGRRQTVSSGVANRGDTFVDINAMMPMIMVERLETLKDGASAVYGSDAVAGVVNFITRDNFEGMEIRYDKTFTTRGDDHNDDTIALIFGAGNDRSHVTVAASFLDRKGMHTTDRDFPYETLSSFGNPGSFKPLGVPLIGFAGVFNADPECGVHSVTSVGPVPTGTPNETLCFYDFGPNYSLVPDETRAQFFVTASHDVNEYVNFFGEFGLSRNYGKGGYSSSFPNLAFPIISAAHPGNPYGVDVAWRGRAIGDGAGTPGSSRYNNEWDDVTTRFVVGMKGQYPFLETWDYEISYGYSENLRNGTAGDQSVDRMGLALNGLGGKGCNPLTDAPGDPGCLWFNPFGTSITAAPGDPEYNSQEIMDFITTTNFASATTDLWTADAIVSGDVIDLPAGTLQAAFGYQYREESRNNIESSESNLFDLAFLIGGEDGSAKRKVNAFFGELAVPILDSDSMGTLDLELAARYTNYEGSGNSTDPKVALLYRPMENLSIRASYGTSLRAPTLFQAGIDQTSLNAVLDGITGSLAFLGETTAFNPNLDPEEATTYGAGFTYTFDQSVLEGLTVGLDYYRVEYENLLSAGNGQAIVSAQGAAWAAALCPALPVVALAPGACFDIATDPTVVRDFDPVTGNGSLVPFRIFVERFNAASAETDGVDLNAAYSYDTEYGTFGIRNETTFVNSFEFQATSTSPVLEGAGNRNMDSPIARSIPEWRSNTNISWLQGNHSANLIVRYISGYDDGRTTGTVEEIDSWTTLDVQYAYNLSDWTGLDGDTVLTVGSNNVLDEDPPFVASNVSGGNDFGYDVKVHDPRGRMVYFRIAQSFN